LLGDEVISIVPFEQRGIQECSHGLQPVL